MRTSRSWNCSCNRNRNRHRDRRRRDGGVGRERRRPPLRARLDAPGVVAGSVRARDRLVRDSGSLRNFTNGSPPHRSPRMRSIDLRDLPLTAIANIVYGRCERSQYTTTSRLVKSWLRCGRATSTSTVNGFGNELNRLGLLLSAHWRDKQLGRTEGIDFYPL